MATNVHVILPTSVVDALDAEAARVRAARHGMPYTRSSIIREAVAMWLDSLAARSTKDCQLAP